MSWIFEDPLPAMIFGVVCAAISGFVWLQTGRKPLIYVSLACIATTAILVGVEKLIVTDREEIRSILESIAADIERNDLDAVLGHVHPLEKEIYERARKEFPLYEFHSISIKQNLDVTVDRSYVPHRAEARFNVVVVLSDRTGVFKENRIPRYAIVQLKKNNDRWLVTDYDHDHPQRGYQQSGVRR